MTNEINEVSVDLFVIKPYINYKSVVIFSKGLRLMLVNFNFSNFKSFKSKAEFSMEPLSNNGANFNDIETGFKKAPHVYRSSAIFGANASGKSNFIEAMLYLKQLIAFSYANSITADLNLQPYKLGNKSQSSLFEVEFIKDDCAYRYIVEIKNDYICREEVYYTELQQDKREKCLFKRTENEFSSPYGIDKEIAKQTIKTRLLISELVNNRNSQDKFVRGVYDWFVRDVFVVQEKGEPIADLFPELYFSDLAKITTFLNKADINIKKLTRNRNILQSVHSDEDGKDIIFDFYEEESDGTITLFDLSGVLMDILSKGKILFMDELDNSLHPKLVKYLVSLFNNPETNPKGAQLVFTSHAHYLMDGENLTRDQIWFVSKENGYSSDLYSLSDFKQIKRKQGAFYNEYMYGIFGAVPNISEG